MSRVPFVLAGLGIALWGCGNQFSATGGGAGAAGAGGTANTGGSANVGGTDESAGTAASESMAGSLGDSGAGGEAGTGGTGGSGAEAGVPSMAGNGGVTVEPSPIPLAGLALWLRADHGVQQRDGGVIEWVDQSGQKSNAAQPDIPARPAYLATGLNGLPTLDFDGEEDFLRFASGFGDFSHGLAAFIVARPLASACASMIDFSNGSEIEDISFAMWQDKWMYEVGDNYLQAGSVRLSEPTLYSLVHRAVGTVRMRIDGNPLDEASFALPVVPASSVRTSNFVGNTLYGGECTKFKGQLSEVILYSRAVTEGEASTIESYLAKHWALTQPSTP